MKIPILKIRSLSQRFLTVATVLSAVVLADALSVSELTAPTFADTEVSTNVHMIAWSDNTRHFNVTLQFDATPSNNVQVALGTDEHLQGHGQRR